VSNGKHIFQHTGFYSSRISAAAIIPVTIVSRGTNAREDYPAGYWFHLARDYLSSALVDHFCIPTVGIKGSGI
jgi:hypothetical protein